MEGTSFVVVVKVVAKVLAGVNSDVLRRCIHHCWDARMLRDFPGTSYLVVGVE